jgi:tRNA (cmo5U34)-methyltransferase
VPESEEASYMSEDKIYSAENDSGSSQEDPFRFNEAVAEVFPDMLRRSIPGYAASIEAIGSLAARYVVPETNCYDLGCSLGAATLAMRQGIVSAGCQIIAIDNAAAMTDRCQKLIAEDDAQNRRQTAVKIVCGDIRDAHIENASMVVMNYTLQFLEVADRDAMIARIYAGLLPGGLLVLSEKVVDDDEHMEELLVDLHHEHKRRNAYSALEVSRKRAALENVLLPESVSVHRRRLQRAGFSHAAVWLRYFNFVSIVAIK